MTDAELADLVSRASRGDDDAFGALVREHHALVFRWALVLSADGDAADDLTQLTWVKVHRGLRSFRGGAKFSTWLYRVMTNASTDHKRLQRVHLDISSEAVRGTSADSMVVHQPDIGRESLVDLIRGTLGVLPARQREVFAMIDLDDVSIAECAERLNIAEATVRVTLFNARRTLREEMLAARPRLMEEYGT